VIDKRKSPPAATGGASKCHSRATALDRETLAHPVPEIQKFRAAILGARFGLNPDLALLVAQLALGEVML
jgi:hypothetical protein